MSAAPRAAVIGAGEWGTVFACLLAERGYDTCLWARRQDLAEQINAGENQRYLPGHPLPENIRATTDAPQALAGAEIVVVAVPSQSARAVLTPLAEHVEAEATVVSLMKGIELGTGRRMSEVIAESLRLDASRVVVVSGPNLADEIAAGQPTATVVACSDQSAAQRIVQACATSSFRPYVNSDVLGVELCGAVKNVIALAVGVAAGKGLGDNSKASIMTRGLVEITRLGIALGAEPETCAGLAGMGDLVATCSSPLSRNQQFGRRLGEGMSPEQAAAASRGVAEGARSARAVLDVAHTLGVEMPITAGVVALVEGQATVEAVTDALMNRPRKAEGVDAVPVS